jgi:uncharacterized protein
MVASQLVEQLRAALSSNTDVLEAYLFGSVARGQASAHSDLDVAIYVDPSALKRPGFGVAAEIAAELGASLGRDDVEVLVLNVATLDEVREFARLVNATIGAGLGPLL